MKTYKFCLLLAVSICAITTTHAQTDLIVGAPLSARPSSQSIINEPTSETGSFIKKEAVYGLLEARGELSLTVTVGPDGKAKQVADFSSISNPEMAKFAASILLMTKFKPAVCGGTPCSMQFPFNVKLRSS